MPQLTPVEVIHHKTYVRSRASLANKAKSAPVASKAFDQCEEILLSYKKGLEQSKSLTKHGESRIPDCFKYDLAGAYRLVLQRVGDGALVALFVGDHEDVDSFLDRNRGKRFEVIRERGKPEVVETRDSPSVDEAKRSATAVAPADVSLPINELDAELFTQIGLAPIVVDMIRQWATETACNVSDVLDRLEVLSYPSEDVKKALIDCVTHLFEGDVDKACNRLRLEHARQNGLCDHSPNAFVEALRTGEGGIDLFLEGQLNPETVEHIIRTENFEDWLLFLHPDQQKIVDRDYSGPARLLGVPGSGKTCVLIHRAYRLALKYPNERILVLTYNRALSHLPESVTAASAWRR